MLGGAVGAAGGGGVARTATAVVFMMTMMGTSHNDRNTVQYLDREDAGRHLPG